MRILFLDFDGVMIPTRAYWLEGQTRPVSLFDPCAVSLLNKLCIENNLQIVIVSSWRYVKGVFSVPDNLKKHLVDNGVKEELIHEDHSCPFKLSSSKYNDVSFWLENHPEVTDYLIIDDDLSGMFGHRGKIITPKFHSGLDYEVYLKAVEHFTKVDSV